MKKYLNIIMGCILIALAFNLFIIPVRLLDDIKKENPSLYEICTKNLNKVLRTNSSFSKKAGLIVHQDDRYTNTE